MWTLEQGIEACRAFESSLEKNNYHCAIGGGVMKRGHSDKDLDVFIYPHRTTERPPHEDIMSMLTTIHAVSEWEKKDHEAYGDGKDVYSTQYQGKRIDFFFVQ